MEVRFGERSRVIFDAGTGMRPLGHALLAAGVDPTGFIFLTHFHWDHIQGFPFFVPIYEEGSRFDIVGPMQQNIDIRSLFAGQMGPVYFPVPFTALSAELDFHHLNQGTWVGDDFTVTAMRVRHPSFTVGYRLAVQDRVITYVPDNELDGGGYEMTPGWEASFLDFIRGSDVLIHDAMYTEEEYRNREGWGHSTFLRTLDVAGQAEVARLFFFHHSPERTDEELDGVVDRMREVAHQRGYDMTVAAADEGVEFLMEVTQ